MDDFVINVRQIGNYKQVQYIGANDLLLIQQGGIGGPYQCVTQDGLLGQVFQRLNVGILPAPDNKGIAASFLITPLGQRQGFNWYVDSDGVQRYLQNGPAGYWSQVNTSGELIWATLPPGEKDDQIDTTQWDVIFELTLDGQLTVGGVTIIGPPSAPTDATTVAWVQANTVASFNTRIGAVTMTLADVTGAGGAPLASPGFTGIPTAPTPVVGNSSTQLATTAFVAGAIAAISAGVSSFNARTGAVVLSAADVTGAGGALLASPALTGVPLAPTAAPGTSTTQIATTAFVAAAVGSTTGFAPINSPAFTGNPTAPTPSPGNNTGSLATTAFVTAAVVASTTGVVSVNGRTGAVVLATADITAAGGALSASPSFTGVPLAPTAAPGTTTTQIATTAFVASAITAVGGVTTFNTRSGAVVLSAADITAAGGALLASPVLTGTPTAPTATAGNSSTQIATTAFIANAIATGTVTSFNSRVGPVTLSGSDVSAAGGALLTSPAFSGVPTAPTAAPGTNTTQVASTGFVSAAVTAGLSAVAAIPNQISGLNLASTGNNIFSIGTGSACSDDASIEMALTSSFTKTIAAWAVGSGNGALDSGAIAASTWYHVFLIKRTDTNVVDLLISLSLAAPTLPANYTKQRRIGSLKTATATTLQAFTQVGDQVLWQVPVLDRNNFSIPAATVTLVSLPSVPSGVKVLALGNFTASGGPSGVISSPDQPATSLGGALFNLASNAAADLMIRTNANQSLSVYFPSAGTIEIFIYGWIDYRGR